MDVINLFSITPKKRISANDEMVSIFVEKMAVFAKMKKRKFLSASADSDEEDDDDEDYVEDDDNEDLENVAQVDSPETRFVSSQARVPSNNDRTANFLSVFGDNSSHTGGQVKARFSGKNPAAGAVLTLNDEDPFDTDSDESNKFDFQHREKSDKSDSDDENEFEDDGRNPYLDEEAVESDDEDGNDEN